MKKKYILILILVVILGLGLTYWLGSKSTTDKQLLTSEQAVIETIKNKYTELKDYPSDNLPPKSISTEQANDGWYIAFVQEGSGRPIISARCFFVDVNNNVTNNGEYIPILGDDSVSNFSAKTCMPIVSNTPPPSTSNNPPLKTPPTNNPPSDNPVTPKCELQTCHGLDVTCGPNPPDMCTEMYAMGDSCLQYVQCGIQNGKCQVIENSQFTQCKSCVENCINTNKDDPIKMFECESSCR